MSPQTGVSFRGVGLDVLGTVDVVGSCSGRHGGVVKASSDGNTSMFVPDQPFEEGETVTVRTGLAIRGAHDGAATFSIERSRLPVAAVQPPATAPLPASDTQSFASRTGPAPARA